MDDSCLVVKNKSWAVIQLSSFLFYKKESLLFYERKKKDHHSEALAAAKNIKATARKYNVQPAQIRCWKRHFDMEAAEVASLPAAKVASLPAAAAGKTLTSMNNKSTKHIGPTKKIQ